MLPFGHDARPPVTALDHAWAAFVLGVALGAAPGPVQLLILSESAKGGLPRGLRVMLGANGMLVAILLALALGLSAIEPGETVLRVLKVAGGLFLIALGALELRSLVRHDPDQPLPPPVGRPTLRGVMLVLLNPGAWIFIATTGSAVIAQATTEDGRVAAIATALALGIGVSCSDLTFTLLGSGGRRVVGDRGVHAIRGVLSAALVALGAWFVWRGVRG
jgi:threonine/homoserine/homoserine lactone efflux protein